MKRLHKAFVNCSDDDWRRFRAYCVAHSATVQDELARLVRNEVLKDTRRAAAAVRRRDKARLVLEER